MTLTRTGFNCDSCTSSLDGNLAWRNRLRLSLPQRHSLQRDRVFAWPSPLKSAVQIHVVRGEKLLHRARRLELHRGGALEFFGFVMIKQIWRHVDWHSLRQPPLEQRGRTARQR